jgi:hypothetical protein
MARLSPRIEALQAHQAATAVILSAAKTEFAVRPPSPAKKQTRGPTASPTRRRKSSGHSSPVRIRTNTAGSAGAPRRRSSGALLDEQPLDTLLRTLALSLPGGTDPSAMDHDQFAALANTLSDRTEKANDVARNAQEAFEQSAATRLADSRRAIQLLRDSLLAESPFGEVRLVDPEIEGSIAVLSQEVDKVRGRVEAVDLSRARRKSEKRTELIRRWG